MGSAVSAEDLRTGPTSEPPGLIDVDATYAIDYVELIAGGRRQALWWERPMTGPSGRDVDAAEALFQLELGWGERRKATEWDVEIRVENGTILEEIPRFRGLEVVSPLDAADQEEAKDRSRIVHRDPGRIRFRTTSLGNATNSTPSTQGMALRVSDPGRSRIAVTMNGRQESWSMTELRRGSRSGNLGAIDSPAFRVSAILPDRYRWRIPWIPSDDMTGWVHVRVRLKNGHWAISSPIWITP